MEKIALVFIFFIKAVDVIQLKDGGYEEVYVYVQDTNEENELLLHRIQVNPIRFNEKNT